MGLFVNESGYKRFGGEARKGEKELTGKDLEAALDADLMFRQNEAALIEAANKSGEVLDDSARIVNSSPLYGPAKLGEVAPLLARSDQYQNEAEAKALGALKGKGRAA